MHPLKKLCICGAFVATVIVASQPGELTYVSEQTQAKKVVHTAVTTTTYPVEVISPTVLLSYANSQPLIAAIPLQRWNTKKHDPSATWPGATDITRLLPMAVQVKFACIRYQESRNHMHAVESSSHAGGWYQFVPYIWNFARGYIHGLPASAAAATGNQQSRVAVWYYRRNNGFMPEWSLDRKVCNL